MTASAKRARRRLATPKPPQHDRGADGPAALCRPSSALETAAAGVVVTQLLDAHLIDRMHRGSQLTDRLYEAALKVLEMSDAAGLRLRSTAGYGRQGDGFMTETMSGARKRWEALMDLLDPRAEALLISLCHEKHPGMARLTETQDALRVLANHWKIYD